MAVAVVVPKMGLKMESATLVRWLRAEGERVEAGEAVAEIETDKVTAQVTAPVSGLLTGLRAQPGDTLPVGAVLAYVGTGPEDRPEPSPGPVAAEVAAAAPPVPSMAGAGAPTAAEAQAPGRLSPAARRLAQELGVDPDEIARAHPGVRVTREDVERWAAARRPASPVSGEATPAVRRVPASFMRRTIARRMVESLREAAQLTLSAEVDVTELVRVREDLAPRLERRYGVRPTYTDFLVRAMALAVASVPQVNARWDGDAVILLPEVNVGVAVALEDGLIVPVVQGADRLSLIEISRRVRDLAERARTGALLPGEASGATITLTNLGAEGVDVFTPILNPPEVAILGAGRIRSVPVLADGRLEARQVMTLSLTIDHRVVDGAPGARYLRRVGELLADPLVLLAGGA
ncbi:dihydrolipoamide acetyltransferase family protein [Caldinitratiruptor microaerophilus]|uniref:Dihydrolipoamide acetyltransferase component of pyruvate dehydrogenase complex n=1 Tax=Caldinitratiruptor microaerophilus TaxID=671077 RepID=A0AA35CLA3_9FIRM|nr:dihydrolipoamide acetyltransferase family protein [Caldinitratiruptor microaerophilus]BDG59592.1 dihydrolipoyllysine-residue acetyltransferase component of acetoin cleaving system [Caldinitratiruptor microaerophilus]